MTRIALTPFLAAIAAILLSGCTAPSPSFEYPPASPPLRQAGTGVTPSHSVTVENFRDFRGESNDLDPLYLYFIPLCPFGYFDYERPEDGSWYMGLNQYRFTPGRDLSRAAAISLKHANLFTQVMTEADPRAAQSDYMLRGAVMSTYYYGRTFSYGLSFEGAWLWLIGAPAGTALNRLALCLWLVDRKTGQTVWVYGFEREDYLTLGLYYRNDREMSLYPRLMAEGMNDAVRELEKFLAPPASRKSQP
ncbi:MAG: hypothetical protein PHQ27_05430 [Victivallales bacterium]|nr:hypothetical protein [Victivallales bacterium]